MHQHKGDRKGLHKRTSSGPGRGARRPNIRHLQEKRIARRHSPDTSCRQPDTLAAQDILIRTDAGGLVVFWNEEAARVSGYAPGEAEGKPLAQFIQATPGAARRESIRESEVRTGVSGSAPDSGRPTPGAEAQGFDPSRVLAGRNFTGSATLVRKDGRRVPVYLFASAVREGNGRATGIECVGRDISSVWLAEQSLRSTEEKYAALVSSMSEIVIEVSSQGKILEANPAAALLAGVPAEGLVGRSILEFVHPDKRIEAEGLFRRLLNENRLEATLDFRFDAGRAASVEFSVTAVTTRGRRAYYAVGRDVTERQKRERETRESIEKFRSIFAAVKGGLFLETFDGEILDVNEGACRLLGYTREELIGKRAADLVPASARPGLAQVQNLLLKSGEFRVEGINLRKDGTEVPVDVSGSLVYIEDKTLALVLVQDATERIAAGKALRESERNFRTLADSANDGILIASGPEGRHVYANPRAAQITGYSISELLQTGIRELAHPEEMSKIKQRYEQRLRGEEIPNQYETRIVRRDGKEMPIEITAALTSWQGAPADLVILRDISERKRIEAELACSRSRMATLLSNLPGMAYRCRCDDGWTMEFASEGCFELTGLRPDEVTGERNTIFEGLIHPQDRLLVRAEIREALSAHEPFQLTYRLNTRQGQKWVWEQGRGMYDESGQPIAFEGFITDITARERAEERVRTSEQRYREALDAMWDPVHVVDKDLRIVLANRALKQWVAECGLDPDIEGRTVFETFPFLSSQVRREYEQVFATGKCVFTQEETTVAGDVRFTETRKLPILEGNQVVRVMTAIRDTTEKRRAERKLEESEANFRSLADNAFDGIAVYDADGRFLYVNRRLAEMYRYTVEQLERMAFCDTLRPQDREQYTELILRRLAGEILPGAERRESLRGSEVRTGDSGAAPDSGRPTPGAERRESLRESWRRTPGRYEAIVVRGDGVEIPVELAVSTAIWRGRPAGIAFVRDLSSVREAERAKEQAEQTLRLVFEAAPDAIGLHQDGVMVAANPAAARLLGYDRPEELVGKPALNLVHPDDRKAIEERTRRALAGAPPELLELRMLRRDGSSVWVNGHDAVISWQGRAAILASVRDTSERRRQEQELRESEERYRRLFELCPDGIAVHQDGRLVLVNPAGLRLLGYDRPEDLTGKPVLEVVHPADRARAAARIKDTVEAGKPAPPLEERFLRRDGTEIRVEVMNSPISWQGRPAVLVVARDLSGRR